MVFTVSDDVVIDTAINSSIKNGVLHGSYVWAKIPHAGLSLVRTGSVAHAMISNSNELRTAPRLPKRSVSQGDIVHLRGGGVCIYLGKFVTTTMRSVDGRLVSDGDKNINLWYTPASYSLRKWDGVGSAKAQDLYALDLRTRLQSEYCAIRPRWNGFCFSTPDAISIIGHIDLPVNIDNQISEFYISELRRRRERGGEVRNLLPIMESFSWAINLTRSGGLHKIHSIYDAANILI
jgi:hypothetical protein